MPSNKRKLGEGPLAEAIFDHLLMQIYNGELAASTELKEAALAQEFKVSRGPVREAIEPQLQVAVVTLELSEYQLHRLGEALLGLVNELTQFELAGGR